MRRRNIKIDFVLLFSWQTRDTALTLLTVAVSRQSKLRTMSKVLQVNLLPGVLANFWLFQLILSLLLIKLCHISEEVHTFIHCNLVLEGAKYHQNFVQIILTLGQLPYCGGCICIVPVVSCSLLSLYAPLEWADQRRRRDTRRGQDVTYCHIVTPEGDTTATAILIHGSLN